MKLILLCMPLISQGKFAITVITTVVAVLSKRCQQPVLVKDRDIKLPTTIWLSKARYFLFKTYMNTPQMYCKSKYVQGYSYD